MSDMIERVGMALYAHSETSGPIRMNVSWESLRGYQRKSYIGEARAAIEAMREPTYEMVAHGDSMMPQFDNTNGYLAGADVVTDAYQAMIDAALEGK